MREVGDSPDGGRGSPVHGRVLRRLRSSILSKVLAALMVSLVVSSVVTAFVDARLTRSALRQEAKQLTSSHLRILEQAYGERERSMVATLRNVASVIVASGLTEPAKRAELIGELARAYRNLELDILEVRRRNGEALLPPASVGQAPSNQPPSSGDQNDRQPPLRPYDIDGSFRTVAVPVTAGANSDILVGGYGFADAFAFRLRRQLGGVGQVILVAQGRVVGSTLPDRPATPPAAGPSGRLPRAPAAVRVDGAERFVAYTPIGVSSDGAPTALGVVLPDPVEPLDGSLARSRILTSVLLALLGLGLAWLLTRAITRPIVELARTAARITGGDLKASFGRRGDDEVGMLADCLERMTSELRTQAQGLKDSSRRIVTAQDGERHRLARDLHDGVQQQLIVLRMQVGMIAERSSNGTEVTGETLEALGQQLDDVIQRLRETSHDLYPSILVDRGLSSALHSHVGRFPVPVRLRSTPDPLPRLTPAIEGAAYFVVSEALTNVLKHANASDITISLVLDDASLSVTVEDDGGGFRLGATERRGGLMHMEDRVRSFGGHLEVSSSPGKGTRVSIELPIGADEQVSPLAGGTSAQGGESLLEAASAADHSP